MHKKLTNMQLYFKICRQICIYFLLLVHQFQNTNTICFNKFIFIERHYPKSFKNKLII